MTLSVSKPRAEQSWPFSGLVRDDDRWLSPVNPQIIRDVGPRFVFLKNVRGLIQCGLGEVLGSLADLGFDAEWGVFSAAEIGAPHHRPGVFLLAHSRSKTVWIEYRRRDGKSGKEAAQLTRDRWWSREPGIHRVDDGAPSRVDRLRYLGNNIVPEQAAAAFRELWERIA